MTNKEFNEQFRKRTLEYAVMVFKFIEEIPSSPGNNIIKYQLGKAASSAGANFRAFCRGRSVNERFAKICIVVEEADESVYWLEILDALNQGDKETLMYILQEGREITAISTSIKHSTSH